MKEFFIFVISCFFYCSAQAEIIERKQGESSAAFIQRFAPRSSELAHAVIEANYWKLKSPVIIAFFEHPQASEDISEITITGYIFIPIDADNKYQKILIDGYGAEGGYPKVESIFFEDTDKTKNKKIVSIISWEQNHAILKGTYYETYIYAFPKSFPYPEKLTYLKSLSEKVSEGCDCWRPDQDGPSTTAKYKTAAEVKNALRKLSN